MLIGGCFVFSNNKTSGVSIITHGVSFIAGDKLIAIDTTGKSWTVNYKDAKFYEEWIDENGKNQRRGGNFENWIKGWKAVSVPGYDGPGIVGVIKITGVVKENNNLIASEIGQQVQ